MTAAVAQQEITFSVGDVATYGQDVGVITETYHDEEGKACICLQGPGFSEHEFVYQDELTPGGKLTPYRPTLTASHTGAPNGYGVRNLEKPDGLIPAGWAVEHKADGVYVAWGLTSEDVAVIYAHAHMAGIHYFGSKM